MSGFIITDGNESRLTAPTLVRAKKAAKRLYRESFPDVYQYVEMFFTTRRDGTVILAVDDGRSVWASGIEIVRER